MAQRALRALCLLPVLFYSAAAQNSTVNADPVVTLLLEPIVGVTYAGSVITAKPTATLYSVDCVTTATTSIPSNLCSVIHDITVLQGPSTFSAEFTIIEKSVTIVEMFSCGLANSLGLCTNTVSKTGAATTFMSTYTDLASSMSPVTITAGADLLSKASASVSASSATSGAGSQSNGTSLTTTASSGAKGTATLPPSTGGVARMTQPGIFSIIAAGMIVLLVQKGAE
ncbi:hypothetical protein OIDMADRAFT_184977 [Oidiodendron maius Zn]|uniref:Uncharacterized protein n=1 Tax=Oidiodendron maius (strain Zn) TaxID=913774 RepID=A0A0C3GMV2_OIDMZ|nr:hypothetical protein OIDMADRAFT_184977 [Oidiodendron maius Zn]